MRTSASSRWPCSLILLASIAAAVTPAIDRKVRLFCRDPAVWSDNDSAVHNASASSPTIAVRRIPHERLAKAGPNDSSGR
jgi:hypothetical protein